MASIVKESVTPPTLHIFPRTKYNLSVGIFEKTSIEDSYEQVIELSVSV